MIAVLWQPPRTPRRSDAYAIGQVVLEIVAAAHGITVAEMLKRGRVAHLVSGRQVAIWVLREVGQLSWSQIVAQVRRSDHTTAMWAHNKVRAKRVRDTVYSAKTDTVLQMCRDALITQGLL